MMCIIGKLWPFLQVLLLITPLSLAIAERPSPSARSKNLDLITDPQISARCKRSLAERQKKLELKQKANSLVSRSQKIRKITPKERRSVSKKIDFILNQLHQEIRILNLQISQMEEDIVRQGCPGIIL